MADWILVVDDDVANLKLAGHILSKQNMRVSAIKSGAAMLTFLQENRPNLVLLDVKMPEMDGFEAMRKLREMEEEKQLPKIPVIFLSASEEDQAVVTGLGLGAEDFIQKPFSPDLLTVRVRHAVELDRYRKKYGEILSGIYFAGTCIGIFKVYYYSRRASGTRRYRTWDI